MVTDVVGQKVPRDQLPVGFVPPGKNLVQFWNLACPIQGPDYNNPAVTVLLSEMLSVRRLFPSATNVLGLRIYTTLPAALGHDSSVVAAMTSPAAVRPLWSRKRGLPSSMTRTPAAPDSTTEPSDHRPPFPCCGGRMIIIEKFERWSRPRAPPRSTRRTAS